jgi:sugar phosphate permease
MARIDTINFGMCCRQVAFMLLIRLHPLCLCALRLGIAWPAMHNLIGIWIPGNERSRFVSAYLGSSIGVAIAYPLFGYVIKMLSWEWVFHISFIVGTIWFALWQYHVYDSPEKHPRIHPAEKNYILQVLGSSVLRGKGQKVKIPWWDIITSRCVWVSCLTQIGAIYGLFTVLTHSPTYFHLIHGRSIEATGILSGLPHLTRTAFSFIFSYCGDYLLTHEVMSRDNVRKLATFFRKRKFLFVKKLLKIKLNYF